MLDGVAVSGRVDRVDLQGNRAIVRDYKGRTVHAGARWAEDGRIQAALYALAVRERLGVEIVGALYQPIGTADQRPRGVVRDDVPGRYVNGDVSDGATLEARLQDSRAIAAQAAADLRAGRIKPCPDRCGYQGGCAHPGICRVVTARRWTLEQRAAIDARGHSSLLDRQRRLRQDRRHGRAHRRGRARG